MATVGSANACSALYTCFANKTMLPDPPGIIEMLMIRRFANTGEFDSLHGTFFRHVATYLQTGYCADMASLSVSAAIVRYKIEELQEARAAGVSAFECAQKVLKRWDSAAEYDENTLGLPLTAKNSSTLSSPLFTATEKKPRVFLATAELKCAQKTLKRWKSAAKKVFAAFRLLLPSSTFPRCGKRQQKALALSYHGKQRQSLT